MNQAAVWYRNSTAVPFFRRKVLILCMATTLLLLTLFEVLLMTLYVIEADLFLMSIAWDFQTSPWEVGTQIFDWKVCICFPLNPWEGKALRILEECCMLNHCCCIAIIFKQWYADLCESVGLHQLQDLLFLRRAFKFFHRLNDFSHPYSSIPFI